MGLLFFLAEPGKLRCLADVDEKKILDVELQLVPEQDFSFFEIAPDLVR